MKKLSTFLASLMMLSLLALPFAFVSQNAHAESTVPISVVVADESTFTLSLSQNDEYSTLLANIDFGRKTRGTEIAAAGDLWFPFINGFAAGKTAAAMSIDAWIAPNWTSDAVSVAGKVVIPADSVSATGSIKVATTTNINLNEAKDLAAATALSTVSGSKTHLYIDDGAIPTTYAFGAGGILFGTSITPPSALLVGATYSITLYIDVVCTKSS